jgi:hypothetical protein
MPDENFGAELSLQLVNGSASSKIKFNDEWFITTCLLYSTA